MIRELRPKYPGLPLVRMCQLLGVSRSLLYRRQERPERAQFYARLKVEIAMVVGLNPGYGYRRVRIELGARGVTCGYKSVRRAMKEAGLSFKPRVRRIRTSDGAGKGSYPNLLRGALIDSPGKAWVADLTYIGLPHGFGYLACVLDVHTRRVVGLALGTRIDSALTAQALKNALEKHPPQPGWIHHSDRGSQYLSEEYVKLVQGSTGQISCSAKACPQDNAIMESFFKTLKNEEVWLEDYENLAHAKHSITEYIGGYYNVSRLHSSLGYKSPAAFEADLQPNSAS